MQAMTVSFAAEKTVVLVAGLVDQSYFPSSLLYCEESIPI
jgi:hypothetical protein